MNNNDDLSTRIQSLITRKHNNCDCCTDRMEMEIEEVVDGTAPGIVASPPNKLMQSLQETMLMIRLEAHLLFGLPMSEVIKGISPDILAKHGIDPAQAQSGEVNGDMGGSSGKYQINLSDLSARSLTPTNQYTKEEIDRENIETVYEAINARAMEFPGGNSGGNCHDNAAIKKELKNPLLDEVAQTIRKVIEYECGSGVFESRRYDPSKIITGLKTKNLSMSRSHKEEMQMKRLMLTCDISGSCADVCHALAAACYKTITYDPRLVILFHSNNDPYLLIADDATEDLRDSLVKAYRELSNSYRDDFAEYSRIWSDVLNFLAVKSVISFGDEDAITMYRAICENVDSFYYMSNSYKKSDSGKVINRVHRFRKKPKVFFASVGTPSDVVQYFNDYMENGFGLIPVEEHTYDATY